MNDEEKGRRRQKRRKGREVKEPKETGRGQGGEEKKKRGRERNDEEDTGGRETGERKSEKKHRKRKGKTIDRRKRKRRERESWIWCGNPVKAAEGGDSALVPQMSDWEVGTRDPVERKLLIEMVPCIATQFNGWWER